MRSPNNRKLKNRKQTPKSMIWLIFHTSCFDLGQEWVIFCDKNLKLFAYTEFPSYLCIVKRLIDCLG